MPKARNTRNARDDKEIELPTTPEGRLRLLLTEIDGYIDYSETWGRVFAFVYYALRMALIVLSAMAAAKDLIPPRVSVPLVSLAVAVGTALDTWLKTGQRYKAHYMYHDKFIALYVQTELAKPEDADAIETFKAEFARLIDDYGVAALPS